MTVQFSPVPSARFRVVANTDSRSAGWSRSETDLTAARHGLCEPWATLGYPVSRPSWRLAAAAASSCHRAHGRNGPVLDPVSTAEAARTASTASYSLDAPALSGGPFRCPNSVTKRKSYPSIKSGQLHPAKYNQCWQHDPDSVVVSRVSSSRKQVIRSD